MKNDTRQKPAKPKTSKLAIASFLLGILTFPFYLLAAVPAIILATISILKIKKNASRLRGKALAVAGIIIATLVTTILTLWSLDAPPIPNDYTIADLGSAPPDYFLTYELLDSLSDKEEHDPNAAPAIGLSAQDVNTIRHTHAVIKRADHEKIADVLAINASSINQAWTNAKKGSSVINELNRFPHIADLTGPHLDAQMKSLQNLRRLLYVYEAYVYLQAEQPNSENAVNQFIQLDSVFRKLSITARSTVTKMVCYAGLKTGLTTANFIVNNPHTQQQSLDVLAAHFKPLKDEHISMRNQLIFDYLTFKNTLKSQFPQPGMRNTPFLKLNSTFRLYRNFCEDWISPVEAPPQSERRQLSVWPSICPNLLTASVDSQGHVPWYYKCYNPMGSLLIVLLIPTCDMLSRWKTNLQVQDDLFQIVLNKRLGQEVSLKASAYSDEYIIDLERKMIFSPGPDGTPHTKDDIKLPINPKVLGLASEGHPR